MSLTEFLLARIAEDQAVAQAAAASAGSEYVIGYDDRLVASRSRVLAECTAKRRIIELHTDCEESCPVVWGEMRFLPADEQVLSVGPGPNLTTSQSFAVQECWCPTLAALASVYAGHPDFDPSWATETPE